MKQRAKSKQRFKARLVAEAVIKYSSWLVIRPGRAANQIPFFFHSRPGPGVSPMRSKKTPVVDWTSADLDADVKNQLDRHSREAKSARTGSSMARRCTASISRLCSINHWINSLRTQLIVWRFVQLYDDFLFDRKSSAKLVYPFDYCGSKEHG